MFVQVKQNCITVKNVTSLSAYLSLSMSSRSHSCPMSTEWITCRWMRRRRRRFKTPKWSGQTFASRKPDTMKRIMNTQFQEGQQQQGVHIGGDQVYHFMSIAVFTPLPRCTYQANVSQPTHESHKKTKDEYRTDTD